MTDNFGRSFHAQRALVHTRIIAYPRTAQCFTETVHKQASKNGPEDPVP